MEEHIRGRIMTQEIKMEDTDGPPLCDLAGARAEGKDTEAGDICSRCFGMGRVIPEGHLMFLKWFASVRAETCEHCNGTGIEPDVKPPEGALLYVQFERNVRRRSGSELEDLWRKAHNQEDAKPPSFTSADFERAADKMKEEAAESLNEAVDKIMSVNQE